MTIYPEHVRWCRTMFDAMNDHAVWAVPRSGLVFRKDGDTLCLISRMRFSLALAAAAAEGEDVPPTAEALLAYQDQDLAIIRDHFKADGIQVEDRT